MLAKTESLVDRIRREKRRSSGFGPQLEDKARRYRLCAVVLFRKTRAKCIREGKPVPNLMHRVFMPD